MRRTPIDKEALVKEQKKTFLMIGKLRDEILSSFYDLETGKAAITNKVYMMSLSDKIEKFIKVVDNIDDIHDYDSIKFKLRSKDGNIINRAFSRDELEKLMNLWLEDCASFETQYKKLVYHHALLQKSASISRAYNSQVTGINRIVMTPEIIESIITNIIMVDDNILTTYERFLKRLINTALPAITIKRTIDTIIIDFKPRSEFGNKLKTKLKNYLMLYEGFNSAKGFYNPFDDGIDNDIQEEPEKPKIQDLSKPDYSLTSISKIKLWNPNTNNKVVFRNNSMFAGQHFCEGDTIEESPVRMLSDKDLYSETVRDMAFPVDPIKRLYGIPLGYAGCYKNSAETNLEGNIDYEYDPEEGLIRMYAIKPIKKGEELIILADKDDFGNEIKPGQFQYAQGVEPIYKAKFTAN